MSTMNSVSKFVTLPTALDVETTSLSLRLQRLEIHNIAHSSPISDNGHPRRTTTTRHELCTNLSSCYGGLQSPFNRPLRRPDLLTGPAKVQLAHRRLLDSNSHGNYSTFKVFASNTQIFNNIDRYYARLIFSYHWSAVSTDGATTRPMLQRRTLYWSSRATSRNKSYGSLQSP